MPLGVNDSSDWKVLRERGLTTVVDPLVFRAADVSYVALRSRATRACGRRTARTWMRCRC
jgi:hypothetical protein